MGIGKAEQEAYRARMNEHWGKTGGDRCAGCNSELGPPPHKVRWENQKLCAPCDQLAEVGFLTFGTPQF